MLRFEFGASIEFQASAFPGSLRVCLSRAWRTGSTSFKNSIRVFTITSLRQTRAEGRWKLIQVMKGMKKWVGTLHLQSNVSNLPYLAYLCSSIWFLLASDHNHPSVGIVAATQRTSDLTDSEARLTAPPASQKRKRGSSPVRPQTEPASTKKRKKRAPGAKDREYGVSRGIDFVDVACVINFDVPTSARSYTHRVGRTARAGRSGIALSLIVPKEEHGKNRVLSLPSAARDEKVFSRVEKEQAARGAKVEEWKFEKGQVEGFRYRMEDALRSVTASAIKEARIKELKQEILASNKLKVRVFFSFFGVLASLTADRLTSRTTRWIWNICGTTNHCIRRVSNRT